MKVIATHSARRGRVLYLLAALGIALAATLHSAQAAGAAEGPRFMEPLSVTVDSSVRPQVDALPAGKGRAEAAPVAALADSVGDQGEFVADELIVATGNGNALRQLLDRWHGKLMKTVDPVSAGLDGVSPRHLIRIDTATVETDTLDRDLGQLEPDVRGAQRVSSTEGLAVLAAAARASVEGLDVDLNWLGYDQSIRTRSTTEVAGSPNPFTEPGLCEIGKAGMTASTCVQSIGVGEAWSLLARSGRLPVSAPVRIAMIDCGFAGGDADWPPIIGPPTCTTNSIPCSGGASCPFHGHGATSVAMDLVDSKLGYAGVAGLVASPMLLPNGIALTADIFTVESSLNTAVAGGANVVNMSFGGMVPAAAAAFAGGFDSFVQAVRANGIVLFAAAGNAGKDVDVVHCFGACWEAEYAWPCETTGVLCVGGLGANSRAEFASSNFGRGGLNPGNSVDIWAPWFVRVGLDPSNPGFPGGTKLFTGTSAASPFAAGVAALIWAASPGLTAAQVEFVMLGSAQLSSVTSSKSKATGEIMVDAEAGVLFALGGNAPPDISIVKPATGSTFARGLVHVEANATDDNGPPSVVWFVDGKAVDTGATADLWLHDQTFGQHKITAVAKDGIFTVPDADGGVTITLTNNAPTVAISTPTNGQTFHTYTYGPGQTICLTGTSYDVNNDPASLSDAQVRWEWLDVNGVPRFATGHRASLTADSLGNGTHTIRFVGMDDGALTASAAVSIAITLQLPTVYDGGGGMVAVGC